MLFARGGFVVAETGFVVGASQPIGAVVVLGIFHGRQLVFRRFGYVTSKHGVFVEQVSKNAALISQVQKSATVDVRGSPEQTVHLVPFYGEQ